MIIKAILASLLGLLVLYALQQFPRSKPISLLIILCCTVGTIFVLKPGWSTTIANWLGVGRGADLVIYLLSVVSISAVFNLHLRLRASNEILTSLSRAVALLSARKPDEL